MLLLATLWLWRVRGAGVETPHSSQDSLDSGASDPEQGAKLDSGEDSSALGNDRVAETTGGSSAGASVEDARASGAWLLSGTVLGAGERRRDAGSVLVVVCRAGVPNLRWSARVELDAKGSFLADVSAWLEELFTYRSLEQYVLRSELEHPELYALPVDLPLEPLRADRGRGGRRIELEIPTEAGASLRGSVRDEWGVGISGASLLLLGGRGPPSELVRLDETRAREDGGFAFWIRPTDRAVLLVVAEGFTPRSVPVGPFAQGPSDLGTLVLSRGASIEGNVRACRGSCSVVAALVGPESRALTGFLQRHGRLADFGGIDWSGDRPLRSHARAGAGPEGDFRLDGLEPATYELWIDHRAEHGTVCVPGGLRVDRYAVTAPAAGVILADDRPWVRFFVHSRGLGLGGARIRRLGEGRRFECPLSHEGRGELMLEPGSPTVFQIEAPGHLPERVELAPLERGSALLELSVELLPARSGRLRVLVVDGRAGVAVERVALALEGEDPAVPVLRQVSLGEEGWHELLGLEPGRYSLSVSSAGSWNRWRDLRLPVRRQLEIEAGRTTEIELSLETGGQLELGFAAGELGLVAADFVLVDAAGRELAVDVCSREPAVIRCAANRSLAGEVGLVVPALAAGTYCLTVVDPVHGPGVFHVEIEEGRTISLEGRLELR